MEPGERLSLGQEHSSRNLCSSSKCSPRSPEPSIYSYRNLPCWPNEWGVIYNESESSDWLSQSVASSTSWSDELEADLTQSLQQQMRQVENTLYRDTVGQLPALSPLREECRLWQQAHPHLRVLGEVIKPSVGCQTRNRQEEIEEQIDEIIAAHGEYIEESSRKAVTKKDDVSDTNEMYKEKIKKAVIDQIFARIWPEIVKRIEPALHKVDTSNQGGTLSVSPELNLKCENSFDDGLASGFNSLTLVDDLSVNSLRTRSGRRSGVSSRRNVSAVVAIKPVVLECSIPIPSSYVNTRTSSAVRRSPARFSQPALVVKFPSPDRTLSPLMPQTEVRPVVKSAGTRKTRGTEKRQETTRTRPQYDAKTGRMITRDETRSGQRRNLKTSPPIPWSKHVALPPIEASEIIPKAMESKSKRSTSAFFKGGRLDSASRPNTSLTTKNQVVLSPLDSLQIRQSVTVSRHWVPEQHSYSNCEALQLKPSDQRQRWRNRSNTVKRY